MIPQQMKPLDNPFNCDAENSVMIDFAPSNETCTSDDEGESSAKRRKVEKGQRKQKDARTSLVDMESEEHKVRMQILKVEKEIAEF